jgi:subtilisin-like proprotein convertase family protein
MRAISIVKRIRVYRRSTRRLLAGSIAILLSLMLAVTVWAVVFTNPAPITIGEVAGSSPSSPYPSNINVSGMTGTVTNVTVTLNNINHTFVPDYDILLVAPTGANMIIFSDVGSGIDTTNVTITLDDAAAASLTANNLVSGTFKPTNITTGDTFPAPAPAPSANTTFAASFNGIDPNGTWSLYVVDDVSLDMGSIGNGWSMTITTSGSPATTFSNSTAIVGGDTGKNRATPYASTIAVSGVTGAITDVNVTLTNVNHAFPDDIDILLVGPTGKRIILMSDTGGSNPLTGVNITFDDAAATGLPDATLIASGSYKPTNFGVADPFPDVLPSGQVAGAEAYPSGVSPGVTNAGPCTLASTFNGTDANGTWSLYVVDDAGGQTGNIMGGWSLDITGGGAFNKRYTNADFDGDGRTDVSIYNGATHNWYIRNSSTLANRTQVDWGLPTDTLVPGDYDGDHKTDVAVWRPSEGNWYIVRSSTGTPQIINWGVSSDIPVPGDYDGDGDTDIAVWRPSQGNWYVRGIGVVGWGAPTDTPVPGADFNGDGLADYVVFRASEGNWYIKNAAGGSVINWGAAGDDLVPGDYDADGITDAAVWRSSEGNWYVLQSSGGTLRRAWGTAGDVPAPGDYDGDCRTDFVVFRPGNGNWYILNSGTTTNALRLDTLGVSGDIPIPSAY